MRNWKRAIAVVAAAMLLPVTVATAVASVDTDGDGVLDVDDSDDDNDGVDDVNDAYPYDPDVCWDLDGDGADDCTIGTDDFGPLADWDPSNDGPDCDGDGLVDSYDTDDDNDGRLDGDDWAPCDPSVQDEPVDPNQPPTAIAGGPYLVAVDGSIQLDATGSTDPDGDPLSYDWTTSVGAFDDASSAVPTFTAGSAAEIIEVQLAVSDDRAATDTTTVMVVVYDPDGGFVTGGGWVDSPASACQDESLCVDGVSGRANFGLVAKYQRGKSVPSGSTTFIFESGGLHFESGDYDALIVTTNDARAQYWGAGTIDGAGDYGFKVWVADGDLDGGSEDTFRIQIWNQQDGSVVYDNSADVALGGGQIVIHPPKGKHR